MFVALFKMTHGLMELLTWSEAPWPPTAGLVRTQTLVPCGSPPSRGLLVSGCVCPCCSQVAPLSSSLVCCALLALFRLP